MARITLSLSGNGNMDMLKKHLDHDKQQKQKTLENIIKRIRRCDIPLPQDLVDCMCLLMDDQFYEAMSHHKGYKVYQAHLSVCYYLKLFNSAVADLNRAVSAYDQKVNESGFFDVIRTKEHDDAVFEINRSMFNVASAAIALKELSIKRHFHYAPEGYTEKQKECFGNNVLYNFILKLRAALHHEHFIMGTPTITRTTNATHKTGFFLDTSHLLRLEKIRERKDVREYVEKQGGKIDIQPVFQRYAKMVNTFNMWVIESIEEHDEYVDYRRCVRGRIQHGERASFMLLLKQWIASNIDPYEYLERYLEPAQMKAIQAYPHRSKEQVDKIIEFADRDRFCNDDIRRRVYKLFNVPT